MITGYAMTEKRSTPVWALVLTFIVALILIAGGIGHQLSPETTGGMIPEFIPKALAHGIATVVELGIGVMVLIPKTRRLGLIGFSVLMLVFLPIHVVDLLQETPVIGSKMAAWIRLAVQFVFIGLGWRLAKYVPGNKP